MFYVFIYFPVKGNIYCNFINTLKNAGLNTTQRWVKYGRTHRLGCFDPAVWLLPRRLG